MALRHVEGPEQEYLTAEEVARALHRTERHLRRLLDRGKFPPGLRPGGSGAPLWLWLDVVAFLHLEARFARTREVSAEKSTKKPPRTGADRGGQGGS